MRQVLCCVMLIISCSSYGQIVDRTGRLIVPTQKSTTNFGNTIRPATQVVNAHGQRESKQTDISTGIINDYTEVLDYYICNNELIVQDASKYNPGDTVVIIQMKGANLDLSNSLNFGIIKDYKNSGNYEFNIIKGKNGNKLSLLNSLERNYDIPDGKVQLIRVPYYTNANVTTKLTCLPWDGSKGGVLVLNAQNTVNLSADIDVSGRGFKGGNSPNPNTTTLYCNYSNFYYPAGTSGAAAKGESISEIQASVAWGKGSPANGGGGGNGHNSGGGGGSNGGAGGFGGYQLDACGGASTDNRGVGGKNLLYNNISNKIFLGGGGGSGQTDNAGGSNMNGGNGGGIVIIKSKTIISNNHKIIAKGADVPNCTLTPPNLCHDANGGGGAGGTVLIESDTISSNITVDVSGGKGGDLVIYNPPNASKIGPGGGGGAGTFWINSASIPSNLNVVNNGGKNGVIIANGNDPYGTTPGQNGRNLFNLKIPVASKIFKKNIDSVRIQSNILDCNIVDFNALSFPKNSSITSWNWNFGDGTTSTSQNETHTYSSTSSYSVKLVAIDISGCKDSTTKVVTASDIKITKRADTSLCGTGPVKMLTTGGSSYVWSPATGLSNPGIADPIATPLVSTKYYVTVTNSAGCSKKDSVTITVNSLPIISKSRDTSICKNSPVSILAGGGLTYSWSPSSSLNNPNIANPVATPSSTTNYIVKVTNTSGCSKTDSIKITVKTGPVISKSKDTSICTNSQVSLFAGGGGSYSWSPSSSLNNPNIANPVATPSSTTKYFVKVTNPDGCSETDSIKITVNNGPVISKSKDTSICTNSQVSLFAGGGVSYSWSASSSLSNVNIANPIAKPLASTKYYVTVTDNNGCSKTDSIKVTVNPVPVISKSNDTVVCKNSPVSLLAGGGVTYSWTPTSTLNNPNIQNPIASPISNTVYTFKVTNVYGCSKTDSIKIGVNPVPVITKSGDTTICKNSPIKIFATGGNTYQWSPASTLNNSSSSTPIASPSSTTLYYVVITDAKFCTYRDSVKISVREAPVFSVSPDKSVCTKTPYTLTAGGGTSYLWSPASFLDNPNISNPVASADASITYSVTISENICNRSATLFTKVNVLPLPNVQATKSNDITCALPSSHLTASGAASFSWTPTSNLNNAAIANPIATPTSTTLYTVTGKDVNGCINKDTISINVGFNLNAIYGLPNSFTPNGDGINDCFGVKYWGQVENLDFSIYNRFGERVFHTSNSSQCWDGKYKGQLQDANAFVYIIKAKTACGKIDKKGTVMLLR